MKQAQRQTKAVMKNREIRIDKFKDRKLVLAQDNDNGILSAICPFCNAENLFDTQRTFCAHNNQLLSNGYVLFVTRRRVPKPLASIFRTKNEITNS